ncbi:hypothetical protein AB9K26_09845 [Psychroserpens sp. XS_ASV72]|uniref:hypothetical protein n=1 Tax=Psychroserpens sp. XS_ASV72 TaxID=3241293 RepID=UPI003514336D
MNILLLEDDAYIADALEDILVHHGHQIIYAYDIHDANDNLEDYDIDLIITDLNLKPRGLSEPQISQTMDGMLTGYIWLRDCAFKKDMKFKNNSIIFSAYESELRDNIDENELKGLTILSKEVNLTDKVKLILEKLDKKS